MAQELFQYCLFKFSDKSPEQNEKLREYFTDKLNFKIIRHNPLTIEKENVTHQDLQAFVEILKSKDESDKNDNVTVPSSERHCNQTQTSTDPRTHQNVPDTKIVMPETIHGNSCRQSGDACPRKEIRDISQNTAVDDEMEHLYSSFEILSISQESNITGNEVEKLENITGAPIKFSQESHDFSSLGHTGVTATLSEKKTTNSTVYKAGDTREKIHWNTTESGAINKFGPKNSSVVTANETRPDVTAFLGKKENESNDLISFSELADGNSDCSETNSELYGIKSVKGNESESKFADKEQSSMHSHANMSLLDQNLVDSDTESNIAQSEPERVSTASNDQKGTDNGVKSSGMQDNWSLVDNREEIDSSGDENMEINPDFSDEINGDKMNKYDAVNPHHKTESHRLSISEGDNKKLKEMSTQQPESKRHQSKQQSKQGEKKDGQKSEKEMKPDHNKDSDHDETRSENVHTEVGKTSKFMQETNTTNNLGGKYEQTAYEEHNHRHKPNIKCKGEQEDENSENDTKNCKLCTGIPENEKVSQCPKQQRQLESGKKVETTGKADQHKSVKGTEIPHRHGHSEDSEDVRNESAQSDITRRHRLEEENKSNTRQMPKSDKKQAIERNYTTDQTMKNITEEKDVNIQQAPQDSNDDNITEYTLALTENFDLKCAEQYLNTESYKSYFKNAIIKDAQVSFRINKSDPEAKAFLKQVKLLKFEKIGFNIRDKEQAMKHLVRVERDTGITMDIFNNFILIVGVKEEVSRAKKLITEKLQNLHSTESESSEFKYNQDKSYMGGSIQGIDDEGNYARGSEHGRTQARMSGLDSAKTANVHAMSLFRDKDTLPSTQRYSQHCPQHFITERSKLVVRIHKADITTFKTDVIVNAANRRLQHGGGVAKVISKAAGWELNKECEDFIKSGNILNVTDIFKSKGWKLPAKFVFHAVGPKWDAYDDKQMCIDDLRHTVLRCLVEAGRQGVSSIALPSISAALFKVPKELCARCYMEAVKHFDIFSAREGSALREIHFIDVDDTMVNYITECFTENLHKIYDPEKLKNDLDFAKNHLLSTAFKTQVANKEKSNSATAKSPSSVAAARETASPYLTGKSFQFRNFTLELKSGHAFDHRAGITITIGKPFDKLSGLSNFQIEQNLKKVDKMPYSKKSYKFFEVAKPGTQWSRLLLAVYPEPDTADAIVDSFVNLEHAIEKCDRNEIHGRIVKGLIITSHMLYNDTKGKHSGGKKVYDSKKIGKFADILHQYMGKLSGTTRANISLTVVGDEDSLPLIQRVMDTRPGLAHVSGAYPKHSGQQHQQRQGGGSDYHHSSQRDEGGSGEGTRDFSYDQTERNYHNKSDSSTSVDPQKSCQICYDDGKNLYYTRCCGALVCSECEMKVSACPFCRRIWRIIKGIQPDGSMKVYQISESADGYEYCPAWRIEYYFFSGIQQDHHPNPGKHYSSCQRVAYLPANNEGFEILALLRLSFIRRLTFTIGSSLTTSKEGAITWNDIHHKTSLHSGIYGYPDSSYMHRVTSELADKGVRFDTMTDEEKRDIDDFRYSLQISKWFYK